MDGKSDTVRLLSNYHIYSQEARADRMGSSLKTASEDATPWREN